MTLDLERILKNEIILITASLFGFLVVSSADRTVHIGSHFQGKLLPVGQHCNQLKDGRNLCGELFYPYVMQNSVVCITIEMTGYIYLQKTKL